MIALDEDALLCDMAETYHIYDMHNMPVAYIATLAKGLKEDSRIMLAINGLRVDIKTVLLAHIADNTAISTWFQSEDGHKGINRPASMLAILAQSDENEVGFENGDDFENEWRRLTSA